MEFNFNTFFGYQDQINKLQDLVLIYGFAVIVFGILILVFISGFFRKIGFNALNSFFILPLMLCLGLSFFVAILPTILFYVVPSDISSVKMLYSWITIFCGMLLFVMFNLNTIKKCKNEYGKMEEQNEFRNRKR